MEERLCDVCGAEPVFAVAAVPFVPMSAAYGQKCLLANAHPWDILAANTACIGGLGTACDEWVQMVVDTCGHLGRTLAEFSEAVERHVKHLEAYSDAQKNAQADCEGTRGEDPEGRG